MCARWSTWISATWYTIDQGVAVSTWTEKKCGTLCGSILFFAEVDWRAKIDAFCPKWRALCHPFTIMFPCRFSLTIWSLVENSAVAHRVCFRTASVHGRRSVGDGGDASPHFSAWWGPLVPRLHYQPVSSRFSWCAWTSPVSTSVCVYITTARTGLNRRQLVRLFQSTVAGSRAVLKHVRACR